MYLGIDIGTSSVKVALTDEAGVVVEQTSLPLEVQRPKAMWSEQDPESWWRATDAAVKRLDPARRRAIKAIGLAGQMHGATLLDHADQPLRPAILWNDGRAYAECAELEAEVKDARLITGNLAMPGFTAPKLLWLRRHEPRIFAAIKTVLLPKDFVRMRMCGDKISDVSDAAGTYWLDVGNRTWSDSLLYACGLKQNQMPLLVEGTAVAGELRSEVADSWGMDRVPIAGGGGDNAAGAIGVGAINPGDAILSLGTSGVSFVVTKAFRPNPERAIHAFCHCLPELWHQMAVHLSAASCIEWIKRLIGAKTASDVFAAAERATPSGELFLPYLSGERTPHNNPSVRGAFIGLDHDTTPERLALAVLEGVALAFVDGLDAIRDSGTIVSRLTVIGGGSSSMFWGKILASALQVELLYPEGAEIGPALGAARLARMAHTKEAAASVCTKSPMRALISPDLSLSERIASQHIRFRSAYVCINPLTEVTGT